MIGDLFDSPWKVLIVAVVLIVLFGSKKLPHAARSLGQSMRILKKEVSDLHHDEPGTEAQATVAAPAPAVWAGASSEPQQARQPG
jgi:sec-independent protein translocase protein TatA